MYVFVSILLISSLWNYYPFVSAYFQSLKYVSKIGDCYEALPANCNSMHCLLRYANPGNIHFPVTGQRLLSKMMPMYSVNQNCSWNDQVIHLNRCFCPRSVLLSVKSVLCALLVKVFDPGTLSLEEKQKNAR